MLQMTQIRKSSGQAPPVSYARHTALHAPSSPGSRPATLIAQDFAQVSIHSAPSPSIQAKLTTNQPGDVYEQQAERIADQVLQGSSPNPKSSCSCGGSCSKCSGHHDEKILTKPTLPSNPGQVPVPPTVHDVLRSSGRPLDAPTRSFMEPRFHHDLSHIRIHTDDAAAQSANSIQAHAYTSGHHLVFARGQYAPGSSAGRHLLAHELAHSLQQSPDPTIFRKEDKEAKADAKPKKDAGCRTVKTQRWGCDTVCSRAGFIDFETPFIDEGGEHGKTGCCNKWPPFVESFARSDLGLNGAASCKGGMFLGIFKVRHGDSEIRIGCTDSTTSDSDHDLEISPRAAVDLFGSDEFPKNTSVEVCPDGRLSGVCQPEPKDLNGPHLRGKSPTQKSCVAKGCYPQDSSVDCSRFGWPDV